MYANEQHKTRPIFWSVFNHENQISTKFDFKSDALLFKKKLPHSTLYFHWYEDEMSKLHWNVEPTETYAELCKQRAIELRERHEHTVLPGYHMNKKHWNTIIANRELDDRKLEELILHSYQLIVESLPVKIRQEISGR
jgi:predicted DNA-binding protein (MmcQ/YjbR family)